MNQLLFADSFNGISDEDSEVAAKVVIKLIENLENAGELRVKLSPNAGELRLKQNPERKMKYSHKFTTILKANKIIHI